MSSPFAACLTGPFRAFCLFWVALCVGLGELTTWGQDCAPPAGPQKSCSAPPRQPLCRPRTRPRPNPRDAEFERLLAEEVAAAVAQATLQAEQERQGAPGGASGSAQFVSPPPSGVVAGASNSVGIRGLEVTFPEWKIALPSIQFPALVKLRRDAEMLLDPGRATMVRSENPGATTGTAFPPGAGGVFLPFPSGTPGVSGAPGSGATGNGGPPANGATGDAQDVEESSRTLRMRRVPKSRLAWDDEYEFVEEEQPDCAPPPSCAPASRSPRPSSQSAKEPIPAPSAGEPEHYPDIVPPAPAEAQRIRRELEDARRELLATRQQLKQLTSLVSRVAAVRPDTGPTGHSPATTNAAPSDKNYSPPEDLFTDPIEDSLQPSVDLPANVEPASGEVEKLEQQANSPRGPRALPEAELSPRSIDRGGPTQSTGGEVPPASGRAAKSGKRLPFGLDKLRGGRPVAEEPYSKVRGPGHSLFGNH